MNWNSLDTNFAHSLGTDFGFLSPPLGFWLWGHLPLEEVWQWPFTDPTNKIQSCLFFCRCVPNWSFWPLVYTLDVLTSFPANWFVLCTVCSPPHGLTPSLTKTLGVLMSHTANKFKSSTEATFFTQSFSAESSDCCFNDFPPCPFQGSISNLFRNQSKSKVLGSHDAKGILFHTKFWFYWNFCNGIFVSLRTIVHCQFSSVINNCFNL